MTTVAYAAEIDLIPADYRKKRALVRTVRTLAIICLALVCMAVILSGLLQNAAAGIRAEMQRLEATASSVNQQRSTIAALALRKEALESKLLLLQGLRRETEVERLLRTVGDAVPGDSIWFLEWRLERVGAIVAAALAGADEWFVVERPSSTHTAPAVRVRMTIAGHARDRAAVSAFVQSLKAEIGIEDVRVQRASRRQKNGLVRFDLLVVADSGSADR